MSRRADIIKEKISILDVLKSYGYQIVSGTGAEQQFSCDMHGDTRDKKPSARVYPESNSWYCFACGEARDAISTVMAKEGYDFGKACYKLEEDYGLQHFIYKEEVVETIKPMDRISVSVVEKNDDIRKQIDRMLSIFFRENVINKSKVLELWELLDMVSFHEEKKIWDYDSSGIKLKTMMSYIMEMPKSSMDNVIPQIDEVCTEMDPRDILSVGV